MVYKVGDRSEPGTVVHARMDAGRLVLKTKVHASKDSKGTGILGGLFAAYRASEPTPTPDEGATVDVTVVVEDPTRATLFTPTAVEVTATNPETGETAKREARVIRPDIVDVVADMAVTDAVDEADDEEGHA
ncbi:hypothetical protein [Streptomyces reniochalinae]|uniref:Uncharacterized protein n=1 Tax=Streptomyces reniochalinae TaxID=2250578 RepID=A0A367EFW4_9ACTN|nr:hypothetical protein [Streptomyces reniochalinae]RCG16954.1 hypothetical protein DQ392_17910 [Streptomyces reniochalinae]